MFTDEFVAGNNPKIREYMDKVDFLPVKEKKELYELFFVIKTTYLTYHPELDEPYDEENLTNLLKQIKPKIK